jgi:cytosine permease
MTINSLRWPELLLVQVGGAICLPMLMIGFLLGQSLELTKALITIFVGNGLLALLACNMSLIATRTRQTTPQLAQATFGRRAGFFFSVVFMLNLIGWFGIHLVAMANLIAARFQIQSPLITIIAVVALGLVITFSVLGGLRWLEIIAKYSLPLLLWGMLSLVNGETYMQSWQKSQGYMLDFAGIIIVVSGLFGCIVDIPTYFCRAKSPRDGIIASLLLFLVVVPFIEILGLGISSPQGTENFAKQVMDTSSGWMRDLFLGFCIFAGWTTNNCNLFSAQTFFEHVQLKPNRINFQQRVILIGTVGTLIALLTFQVSFENLLISITMPLFICGALLMLLNARRRS